MLRTSLTWPAAVMITVPGANTLSSPYFWVIDKESFPVGMLMPRSIAKLLHASTASYRRASSPSFLHGHIQFALSEMLSKPSSSGAHTMLVRASAILITEPAAGSTIATSGAWPSEVAIPFLPLKSSETAPRSFNGSCISPAHCCLAILPVTERSTLLVNQSLHATASNCNTLLRYSSILLSSVVTSE